MLRSTPRKRGRPQASHRAPDGTEVVGLKRQKDGRWRISATGETFAEPDERLAIARFHEKTRKKDMVRIPVSLEGIRWPEEMQKVAGTKLYMTIRPGQPTEIARGVPADEFWAFLRRLILEQPKFVAQMTGIEQIGWLADLAPPAPSVMLKRLGELYQQKPKMSANERGRSKLFWREFCEAVGVATARELTADAVRAYGRAVAESSLGPKSVRHRFCKVKTVLAYGIRQQESVADCRRALDLCSLLEVPDAPNPDPKPIRPADFWAVYDAAEAAGDHTFAALMLAALNLSMYGGEAGALTWDEVDLEGGGVASRRRKTGVVRVGVLWPETIEAVRRLPTGRDTIFNTRVRSYTAFSVCDAWRKHRVAAGVGEEVVFSMIRDAAYTVALTVSLDQARLLAGHKLPGVSDAYVLRNPQMVAGACDAIRARFYKERVGRQTHA